DDDAFAWVERARPLSVMVVGRQSQWLATLLDRDPDVHATFVDPSSYRPDREDAVIFDRWAPPERPGRPSLSFAPPKETPWLAGGGPGGGGRGRNPAAGGAGWIAPRRARRRSVPALHRACPRLSGTAVRARGALGARDAARVRRRIAWPPRRSRHV